MPTIKTNNKYYESSIGFGEFQIIGYSWAVYNNSYLSYSTNYKVTPPVFANSNEYGTYIFNCIDKYWNRYILPIGDILFEKEFSPETTVVRVVRENDTIRVFQKYLIFCVQDYDDGQIIERINIPVNSLKEVYAPMDYYISSGKPAPFQNSFLIEYDTFTPSTDIGFKISIKDITWKGKIGKVRVPSLVTRSEVRSDLEKLLENNTINETFMQKAIEILRGKILEKRKIEPFKYFRTPYENITPAIKMDPNKLPLIYGYNIKFDFDKENQWLYNKKDYKTMIIEKNISERGIWLNADYIIKNKIDGPYGIPLYLPVFDYK